MMKMWSFNLYDKHVYDKFWRFLRVCMIRGSTGLDIRGICTII